MKNIILLVGLTLCCVGVIHAADGTPAAHVPNAVASPNTAREPSVGRFYTDQFLTASTTDFSHDDNYGFGVGVGYQVTKVFAADLRLTHDGLHLENNGVSTIGGRVLARLPFKALSPYGFLGSSFDLRSDQWHLQPGIGAEIGVSKRLKGLSVFGEAGLDANLKGRSAFLFGAGLRWRF